jgi:hypothetical protein
MSIEEAGFFLIIILIGSLPRFYLLSKYGWVGKDTFYHFIVAESIKQKGFPPRTIDQFVIPEQYDYPPLLHVFLSYFDKEHFRKLQYLSPVSDIVTGIVIYTFSYHYLGVQVALIAIFIYLVTPFVFDNALSLNPRSLANLFLVLLLLSWYNFYMSAGVAWLILSVICSSLVLLSHRLTTQCLGILFIALSLWTGSWVPFCVLVAAVALALVVTKGYFLTVLKGHVAFVREFGRKFLDRNTRAERAPAFPSVQYVLFNLPLLVLLPLFFIYPLPIQDVLSQFLLVWIGALVILSIAWVFGEGVRHMICAVPAMAMLWASWIVHNNLYLILVPLGGLSLFFLYYKIARLEANPDISGIVSEELMEAFNYINTNKKPGDVLLCLPLDLTYNAAFFTGCTMLQSSGGFAKGLGFNQELHRRIDGGRVGEVLSEFSPRWIVVAEDTEIDDQLEELGWEHVMSGDTAAHVLMKMDDASKATDF